MSREGARREPEGRRRNLRRLGEPSVRREAVGDNRRRGDRGGAFHDRRGLRVRVQGGDGRDPDVPRPHNFEHVPVRHGDRCGHVARCAGGRARIQRKRRRGRVPHRDLEADRGDQPHALVHDGHARLLATRGAALPEPWRAVHGRARVLQARDELRGAAVQEGGHEAVGLRLRGVPPAEREVPPPRRKTARVHGEADRHRPPGAGRRQHVQRRDHDRHVRDLRHRPSGRTHFRRRIRERRGQRRVRPRGDGRDQAPPAVGPVDRRHGQRRRIPRLRDIREVPRQDRDAGAA